MQLLCCINLENETTMKKIQFILIALLIACSNSVAFANSNSQNYNKAVTCLNDNDFSNDKEATNLLVTLANDGHALSARYLGMMLWHGKANVKDRSNAQNWLYHADVIETQHRENCDYNTAWNTTTSDTFTCYSITIYSVNKGSAGYQDCINRINVLNKQFPQYQFNHKAVQPYHEINVGYFLTKTEAEMVAKEIALRNKDYSRYYIHIIENKYR